MNRDYFVALRERMPRTCMRAIRDALGILVTNPDHVMDFATDFHAELFMVESVLDETHTARVHVWSFTQRRVKTSKFHEPSFTIIFHGE